MSEEEINNFVSLFSYEELVMLFKLKRADLLAQSNEFHYLLENYHNQEEMVLKIRDLI